MQTSAIKLVFCHEMKKYFNSASFQTSLDVRLCGQDHSLNLIHTPRKSDVLDLGIHI